MTDRPQPTPTPSPTPSHPRAATPGFARRFTYPLVGLLQGIVLWLLLVPDADQPHALFGVGWQGAAGWVAMVLPLAWYLGDEAPSAWRRRIVTALGLALLFGVLGAHLTASADFSQALAAAVLCFTLVTVYGALPAWSRWPDYPRLFDRAWRNALALPLAGALTGVLWMLLTAAAGLMHSIGIDLVLHVIGSSLFVLPVTCAAYGAALGAVLHRAELLPAVRRFWLTLNVWFLPLVLAFAVVWVASLCFTGTAPLFTTRHAALYLFWFALLSVVFANAAFQDGRDPPALPAWLAGACRWAWLAMPVLMLIGDRALWLRVQQHGWSNDRIWAAVVGLVLTLHTLGYAASLLRPRARWMAALPATNVAVALVKVVVLLMLVSPLADSRQLAVDSQVARLLDGRIAPDDFDWTHLRRDRVYGRAALARLTAVDDTREPGATIVRRALVERARIADEDGPETAAKDTTDSPKVRESHLAALRQVPVLPAGSAVDPALLQSLADDTLPSWNRRCTGSPAGCLFWLTDLDGSRTPQVLLIEKGEPVAQVRLYALRGDGWVERAWVERKALTLADWRTAIEAGEVRPVPSLWPDLMVNGQRHGISTAPPVR